MTGHSDEFATHLRREVTTLCHCWKLTRRDGSMDGFTDHDRRIQFEGNSYEPRSGFSQSEARMSLGFSIDTSDVEGALSSPSLAENDIEAGLFDGAEIETYLVNWRKPEERALLRKSIVGKIERIDGRFVAELESLTRSLDRPNGRYLRRVCDAELGDARCRANIDKPEFRASGSVLSVSAPCSYRVDGLDGFSAGWFSFGGLYWTSGRYSGRVSLVADHKFELGGIVLVLPVEFADARPGDGFDIRAGCDKQFATCRSKFGNSVNFRGFPHLPGNDAAYRYVTEGGVFDGGVLVE
ncbi:DUF2163 domain-containing protein [Aquamicrobium sp. LC103]|uniref:DUF2163 domain-containing protein n=1 Tax=Aquamicrobium sp. LC103 TaxID=1120658 RepID=UPI00063EA118|nr:DUF2163 domain-containing protein [Aquamicrobium sp. LC103]TKT81235.1 DUF2163 domain-containing protein [Aquamicrobium sp. LC103]